MSEDDKGFISGPDREKWFITDSGGKKFTDSERGDKGKTLRVDRKRRGDKGKTRRVDRKRRGKRDRN